MTGLPRQNGPLRRALLAQGTDECVLWTGCIGRNGYGQAGDGSKITTAHRRVWEWLHGPIPDGLCTDHLCRVRACVNVRHLELVTTAVNNERARDHQQVLPASRFCRNGHPWDATNTYRRANGTRKCRACERDRGNAAPTQLLLSA